MTKVAEMIEEQKENFKTGIELESLVEVELHYEKSDNKEEEENFKNATFLIIKETLTRMGIAFYKEKRLIQSCHILHKQGKYYIVHFKELFGLDGKPYNLTEDDKHRRNLIVQRLINFGLVIVKNPDKIKDVSNIKLDTIRYNDKKDWSLESKYEIGKTKYRQKAV